MKPLDHIEIPSKEPMWRKLLIASLMVIYYCCKGIMLFIARLIYACMFSVAYIIFIVLIVFFGSKFAAAYMQKLVDVMNKNFSGL